jgi:hypothetical protein
LSDLEQTKGLAFAHGRRYGVTMKTVIDKLIERHREAPVISAAVA